MSNNKKNYLNDKLVMSMYLIYIICVMITSVFIKNGDIATLLIPVIFYTAGNVIIRNSDQKDYMKKITSDINDLLLISSVTAYIIVKSNLKSIENFMRHPEGTLENYIYIDVKIFTCFFALTAVVFFILYVVTKGLSMKLNKASHYHNFENDNKGGSNGRTEQQKEQE